MDALSGSHPKMDWEATDLVTAWKSFQQHTEFWFAGPLAKTAEAQKCNYLMIWIGNKGRDIYSTWDLSEDDKKKLDVHYQNFEKHVRPKSNKIYSRYKFLSRVQKEIDTFEEYLTDLKILVKDCGYATPEEMVRDAIVFGTKDHKVREKCITEGSELSLEKAINFARTYELSKAQLKTMESEDKTINMLNKQGSRSSGKKYGKQYTPQRGPPQNNKGQSPNFANKCKNCGGKHERRKCPAFGKQCNKCHKYNHFASVCLSSNKSSKKMHTLDICSESDDDELFVATIDNQELNTDEWTETINVNDVPVNFQLDTGAKCNVLSLNKLKTICSHPIITKQVSPLRSYSGHIIDTVGVINLRCSYKCQDHAVKFHIVDRNVQSVIGAKTCEAMKLLKRIHSITQTSNPQETTKQFLPENMEHQYGDLFTGLGCKEMYLADHLSRSFLKETKEVLVPDLHVNDIHLISYLPIAPEMYAKFQKETANDEHLQELQDVIFNGWPNEKSELIHSLRPYWTYRDELSVIDGLLYKSNKAIVPKALQNEMLDKIHESHLGIVKCKSRARDVLFWIGMGQDIEDKVKACGLCAQHQSLNAKEPMRLKTSLPTSLPLLMPQNVNNSEIIKKLEIRQRKAKTNYDKHCGPELKQLKQGDSIVMYTDGKWKAGKIIQKHHTPRSYVVQTSDGRRYRRNRRHIRPTAYNGNTVENEHFKNNHNLTVRKTSTVCNNSQTLDRSETVASEENESIEPSNSPVTRSGRTVKVPTKLNDYVK
ncbi:unnamed protein product [Mytilus edulis]|uniref:Integrase zinc-binding domain-containing protein n=2 Tax=Mytilus TaxID=6548 RepID=A0A8S3REM9_MYTED|nr:unnamed protein product [Mytilus edulis]